jgi:hypothetical protein
MQQVRWDEGPEGQVRRMRRRGVISVACDRQGVPGVAGVPRHPSEVWRIYTGERRKERDREAEAVLER